MLASTRALATAGLDEHQTALYDAATDWGLRELAPFSRSWDSEKFFPTDVVRRAAEMGFAAPTVPLEFGGAGLDRHDSSLLFEALSYGDVPVAAYLTIHSMVSGVVARFGSDDQRRTWLPRLASADALAAYALTEPSSGSDAAAMRTTARRVVDEADGFSEWYEITGDKAFISGGGVADLYLVMARVVGDDDDGDGNNTEKSASKTSSITAFLVEKGTRGLSFGAPERKMGWNAQPTTTVTFDRVRVRARDAVLGAATTAAATATSGDSAKKEIKTGGGFRVAMQALDGGRVNIGAVSVGGALRAVDAAALYCRQRTAFGDRPLSSFQETQFSLADAVTDLCAARGLVRAAAQRVDEGHPCATLAAAAAKRFASDAAWRAADAAVQRLGGYGYLRECDVERILRDLRVHRIVEGTNEIQKVVIAKELEKMDGVS